MPRLLQIILIFITAICFMSVSFIAVSMQNLPMPAKPVTYYSDCSVINIQQTDASLLTKEEQIDIKNRALLDAVDANAECIDEAFANGQAQQNALAKNVGTGSGQADNTGQANGANGTDGSANNPTATTSGPNQPINQNVKMSPPATGQGAANQVVTGKNAGPCDLYKELLNEASSPEEQTFYKAELKKYGCS